MIDVELAPRHPVIRAASVGALIAHLLLLQTAPAIPATAGAGRGGGAAAAGPAPDDPTGFASAFILTYRAFISPADLFRRLAQRYQEVGGGGGGAGGEAAEQARVLQVLRAWVEHFIFDFQEDAQLEPLLLEFVDFTVVPAQQYIAYDMRKAHERQKELFHQEQKALQVAVGTAKAPTPNPTSSSAPAPAPAPNPAAFNPSHPDLENLQFLDLPEEEASALERPFMCP